MCARANPTQLLCLSIFAFARFASAQATQPQQGTPPNLQLNVERILVPVVVRDGQGRSVGDLKESDFAVFDNGKPRTISSFTIETRETSDAEANSETVAAGPADKSTGVAAPSRSVPGRITVFVFDDLHLNFDDLARVKSAADAALDQALAGSDLAVVVSISGKTNSGLTRDRTKLDAAIAGIQPQLLYRIETGECGAIDYYQADLIENKHDSTALNDAVTRIAVCNRSIQLSNGDREMTERQVSSAARRVMEIGRLDVQTTYGTIAAMVRRLATLPGQKSMILVSPGFLNVEAEAMTAQSQILDLAAQSDITISALDARGLYTSELSASERGPGAGGQNPTYRRNEMRLAEDPMAELADGTGGTFFHNDNDLAAGFRRLAAAPEAIYLLELLLDQGKPDGRYHTLKVKVDRGGLELQARRGYFWVKPEKK
ncbi:MAG: VWA domain-containing protein [Terracidiphilus sp.]